MQEFSEQFLRMVDYGFLGLYRRLSASEGLPGETFIPALARACAIGAFLNLQYGLRTGGGGGLPETEFEMFRMFMEPMDHTIERLPEELAEQVRSETYYQGIGPLCEEIEPGKVILTEDGYEMLSNQVIHNAVKSTDPLGEYMAQKIFEELCRGDYVKKRSFLEDPENVYIPDNRIHQTEAQTSFKKQYPELFRLCYQENLRTPLYRCKRCGMILHESKPGIFSCISKKCNPYIEKRTEQKLDVKGYILNDAAARSIYYPGRLEREIEKVLEWAKEQNIVVQYEKWPGRYEGEYDTWDFKVQLANGKLWLLDGKDVENPHWIIMDQRELLEGAEFIYVVPDDRDRHYLDQINNHKKMADAMCVRVRRLKKMLEEMKE